MLKPPEYPVREHGVIYSSQEANSLLPVYFAIVHLLTKPTGINLEELKILSPQDSIFLNALLAKALANPTTLLPLKGIVMMLFPMELL